LGLIKLKEKRKVEESIMINHVLQKDQHISVSWKWSVHKAPDMNHRKQPHRVGGGGKNDPSIVSTYE
jgi:hypothetical protein